MRKLLLIALFGFGICQPIVTDVPYELREIYGVTNPCNNPMLNYDIALPPQTGPVLELVL